MKLSDFIQMFIMIRRHDPGADGRLLFEMAYDLLDLMDYKRTVQVFLTLDLYQKLLEFVLLIS